ncbi:MAG: T9SS C-terminal target domain-containing protein [Bacteroidetes bacterium]|nr:MAG: T9SS C-terminal target domain-containing protein [Bacteroidota bacterium]
METKKQIPNIPSKSFIFLALLFVNFYSFAQCTYNLYYPVTIQERYSDGFKLSIPEYIPSAQAPSGFILQCSNNAAFNHGGTDVVEEEPVSYSDRNNIPIVNNAFFGTTNFIGSNTTYYFRYRVNNSACSTVFAPPVGISTLRTGEIINNKNVNGLMVNVSNVTCGSVTLDWTSVSPTTTVAIKNESDQQIYPPYPLPPATYQYSQNSLTLSLNGLLPNQTYIYELTPSNGSVASTGTFTTTANITAPTATSATNLACNGFRANWNVVSGATGYYLDVSKYSNFSTMLTDYNDKYIQYGNVNYHDVTGLDDQNTTYYYRVRSANYCISENSNTISATTTAQPTVTTIYAGYRTCTSFIAYWDAVASASGYYVQILEALTNDQVKYEYVGGGTSNSLPIGGLTQGTGYNIKVFATGTCFALASATATVSTLQPADCNFIRPNLPETNTTLPNKGGVTSNSSNQQGQGLPNQSTQAKTTLAKEPQFNLFPNPSNTSFQVTTSINDAITYQLFDLQGKLVKQELVTGNATINISNLSKGTYIVKGVTSNGTSIGNRRLIVK